jgi:hypothetical protein
MRWRIPLVVLLALFVAVSCDEKLVEPAADQVAEAPAFNWMNNPDNGNLKIYRDAFDWIECWSDAEGSGEGNGLRACLGTYPLGLEPEPDCGLQQFEAPVSYQDVGSFDFDNFFNNVLKAHLQGDVWITIRDENTAGECFGDALVAEGWGQLRFNDNDVFGPDSPGNNANTWGARGHGKLTAVDGSRVKFNGHYRVVANNNKFELPTFKVNVH